MQSTGEEGDDTLQQQQLGGQARAGGVNIGASTSGGGANPPGGKCRVCHTRHAHGSGKNIKDQTTKALESVLDRIGNPGTESRTTRSGRKTPSAVPPSEDIRRYFTPRVPPAEEGGIFQPFAAHQHLLEARQDMLPPHGAPEEPAPPGPPIDGIPLPGPRVQFANPNLRFYQDPFSHLGDEQAATNPVPAHPAAFASFFDFVSESLKTSRYAQPRDLHEMAVLQPYGEVWNVLSAVSRRKIWSRLQLFDLVARYDWGQALKLHPGATSIYSLPVDPAALALAAPSGGGGALVRLELYLYH